MTRVGTGVRVKFNLALLPLLAAIIAVFGWLDSRHEAKAVMEAHALHVVSSSSGVTLNAVDPATSPEAVGRRALIIHAVFGLVVLTVILFTVNASVWFFVLRPLDRIRRRIDQMSRGEWRGTAGRASDDELGELITDFDRLGLAVDALAGQLLYAERLATLALVSKRLESSVGPEVQRTVAALSRLQASGRAPDHECHDIADAATRIVAAMKSLDRMFGARSAVRVNRPPTAIGVEASGAHLFMSDASTRVSAGNSLAYEEERQVTHGEP